MVYYVQNGETSSGIVQDYDGLVVLSGGVIINSEIKNSGYVDVSSGGKANSTTINDGDTGGLFVFDGGVANDVTVNSGGYLKVSSDGKAKNVVENGGYVYIVDELERGGHPNVTFKKNTFSGVVLTGKDRWASLHSGTTAADMSINSGGNLSIRGGIANGTTVNSDGEMYVHSGTANNTVVNSGGYLDIRSSGIANSATVNSGGTFYLSGTANSTTVVSEGSLTILSNGTANNTILASSGHADISSGGIANSVTVDPGGHLDIRNGGIANSVTVDSDGLLHLFSGGTANSVQVNLCGYFSVSSGGVAKNVVENGGYVYIVDELENGHPNVTFKKNSFSGVVLTGDGTGKTRNASIHSGTTATDTTVNSDGYLEVLGGIANSTSVNSGGDMYIFTGTANSTTVNYGGHIEIYSGGTATNLVENGGDVYIEDGAEVTLLPNTFSGLVLNGKNATVHSGTTANDTVVNSDSVLLVYSSGFANGVTVNEDGHLWVYERALVNGLTVSSGGELIVGCSGWLTGRITFQPGAIVAPAIEAGLDFDLTQTTAGAAPLVNDLSFISNTFIFTLTVNGMQPDGTYKLAGGAAAFDQTVYVFDTRGKSLGTLTVNGGTLSTPRADYTLKKSGSNLTVDVVAKMTENGPPEPYNNTLYDKTTGVNDKVTTAYGTWLSAPNDDIFIDKFGTVAERINSITYSNRVGTDDPIDYGKIVLEHGAKLSFHAEATAAATFTVYSLTPKKNGKYAKKKLLTLKLKDKDKDGVFTADSKKPLSLQASGDYYVSMEFKDKKAGEAFYNVSLNDGDKGSVFYPLGDNTDDWGDMKTAGYGGAVGDLGVINGASLAADKTVIKDEWIGFGDKFDYKKFTLASAAELSFTAGTTDGPLKLTVCTLKARTSKKGVTTYSQVNVKAVTVKAGLDANLSSLRLEAGDYFFKVQSGDIRKSTDYGVQVTNSTFYTDGDAGWNNVLLDKNALNGNAAYFYNNKLAGNGSIHFDKAGNDRTSASAASFTYGGKQYGGFVGFGDELDFAKITLTQSAGVTFTLSATGDATLEILQLTMKNGKYTKKSLQTVKFKAGEDKVTSKKPVTLEVKDGVSYYVSIKATNTKKTAVDPRTYYNVSYVVETKDACGLAMTEASDTLNLTDAMSFAPPDSDLLANASAFDNLASAADLAWQTVAKLA